MIKSEPRLNGMFQLIKFVQTNKIGFVLNFIGVTKSRTWIKTCFSFLTRRLGEVKRVSCTTRDPEKRLQGIPFLFCFVSRVRLFERQLGSGLRFRARLLC